MFTRNKDYRWYLVTKALQNMIFERFRKGESAAGEKKRECREEIWILNPFLFFARRYADIGLVFSGLMIVGLGNRLKLLVDRPRPDYQIIEPFASGLSFPSGHSLLAVILGGVLVYLVGQWVRPILPRRAIQVGLVLVVVGMGASRVYLGVHWPSDVIGSYVLGVLSLVALVWLRNNFTTVS